MTSIKYRPHFNDLSIGSPSAKTFFFSITQSILQPSQIGNWGFSPKDFNVNKHSSLKHIDYYLLVLINKENKWDNN